MPLQNRVHPLKHLVATSERGTVMGNRGCLHNAHQQIVRRYQTRRWIICVLDFKQRHRRAMTPGQYTELFFLDEATALAAGHRPCAKCNRAKFDAFRAAWVAANAEHTDDTLPNAAALDARLHRERLSATYYQKDKVRHAYHEQVGLLPSGAFVLLDGDDTPHLVYERMLYPWSFAGYGGALVRPATTSVEVLTPRSTIWALAHGYQADVHPTCVSTRSYLTTDAVVQKRRTPREA